MAHTVYLKAKEMELEYRQRRLGHQRRKTVWEKLRDTTALLLTLENRERAKARAECMKAKQLKFGV